MRSQKRQLTTNKKPAYYKLKPIDNDETLLMMNILLETERLILRQFSKSDRDNLVALDSDPEVMRYINGGIPSSEKEITKVFLPDVLSYYSEYENLGFWAVVEKLNNEFVGWVVLRPESRFRIAVYLNAVEDSVLELGYRFCRASWGKGYATEASLALINEVAASSDCKKVVAWAIPENKASIRVMEKLGLSLQQEYQLTAADILPEVELLSSPVIQNLLERSIVKYSKKL